MTGSISGQLCVCDYESSKILDYCVAHEAEITSIVFTWPYPCMITTGLDCQICIWKVREVGKEDPHCVLMHRFLNISFHTGVDPWESKPAPIHTSCIHYGKNLKGIEREKKTHSNMSVVLGASTYRDFKTNSVLAQLETVVNKNE